MAGASVLTVIGWLLAGLSAFLVRLGWERSRALALAGWAAAALAIGLFIRGDGAWGLATGFTIAMVFAIAMLLHAAWKSPARTTRPARVSAIPAPPVTVRDTLRRLAVFALVVPVAFAAAQWFSYALQALVRHGAPLDANALALMLFTQPILWSVLMSWQMTQSNAARMIIPPLVTALLGALLWSLA